MNENEPSPVNTAPGLLTGRRFLLLQGPSSWFWAHLGRSLRSRGGTVSRVGFCPGDRLFWTRSAGAYHPYRGRMADFTDWLRRQMERQGATDVIMLGDGRPAHAQAARLIASEALPVRLWVVEHGYLRPGLILIEPDGMGGASTIPKRFDGSAPQPEPLDHNARGAFFATYAAMDVAYHLSNVAASWLTYPHYRAHSGIPPLVEYAGWIRKAVTLPARRRARKRALEEIEASDGRLFLYPLQLSQDMQLLRDGTGEPQAETLRRVVQSFLAHAEPNARLVVKVHPLDNGLASWRGLVDGLAPRVLYLDGGDLDRLLQRASGVVTINSTVGLTALRQGVPTLALGASVYGSAGLTDKQDLDAFWSAPRAPDRARVEAFCAFLRTRYHVSGTFDGPGALVGAEGLADWLSAPPAAARAGAA